MKKLLALLLAAMLLTVSFAFAEADEPEEEAPLYELSEDNTVFTVRLEANYTTGYQWMYTFEPEGVLEMTGEDYILNEDTVGLAGAGGTYVAEFRAAAAEDGTVTAGETLVTFTYARPWETEGEVPACVLVFAVTVAEDGTLTVE